jgi:2-polyprenyl-6-methoxyphenol hydroxylase-like FAD-dependent oxidoreductase
MSSLPSKIEVLVVGAGPVGMMLALILKLNHISVVVIDKKLGLNTTSNALIINSRTLEIFKSIGILDSLEQYANQINFATYFANNDELLQSMSFSDTLSSTIQYLIAVEQSITEQILYQKLQDSGVDILWGIELSNLNDIENAVIANTSQGNIECQWLVGCDGYGGNVRELAGILRNRHDLPLYFAMFDGQISGLSSKRHAIEVTFHRDGATVVIPFQGKTRMLFEVDQSFEYQNQGKSEHEVFDQLVKVRCSRYKIESIDWSTNLFVHECLVDHYLKNRVILAGDACHTHSPIGGQGLNTGLQDVWNLGWKLYSVIKGYATNNLIATYEQERIAIAQQVLDRTSRLTKLGMIENKIVRVIRNWSIKHIMGVKQVAADLANQIAQTDIQYEGTLVDDSVNFTSARRTRVVLDTNNLCWNLYALEPLESVLPNNQDILKVKLISPMQSWWSDAKFCLVRPDGHIAMYSNTLEEIRKYFVLNAIKIDF